MAAENGRCLFVPSIVDLGDHYWFDEVPFELRLKNGNSVPRRVESLISSCGCAVIANDAYVGRVIPGNSEIAIEGVLRIGDTRTKSEKNVQVLLDDGAFESAIIAFRGIPTYEVVPEALDLGDLEISAPLGEHISTVLFRSQSVRLTQPPIGDCSWLRISVDDSTPTESRIFVTADTTLLTPGRQHARVRLYSDDPWRPYFDVLLTANVTAAVRAVPAHVFLAEGESAVVRFFHSDGAPATVVQSRFSVAGVQVGAGAQPNELLFQIPALDSDEANRTTRVPVKLADGSQMHVLVSTYQSHLTMKGK